MFYNKVKGLFLFAVCGGCLLLNAFNVEAKPLRIVTLTEDFGSIVTFIGGNTVSVTPLVKGSADLHQISAKPSMVISVRNADAIVRLGMDQDSWVDDLIHTARNPALFPGQRGYYDASVHIAKLDVPSGTLDGRQGDIHKYGNPHYWLDPHNGFIIASDIRDLLTRLAPENKALYDRNYAIFSTQLTEKLKLWTPVFTGLKTYQIMTYHSTWRYFLHRFGQNAVGQLEPLPGVPPTVPHLMALRKQVARSPKPPLIIMEPYHDFEIGASFARQIHGKVIVLPTNVSSPKMPTYFSFFDALAEEIKKR